MPQKHAGFLSRTRRSLFALGGKARRYHATDPDLTLFRQIVHACDVAFRENDIGINEFESAAAQASTEPFIIARMKQIYQSFIYTTETIIRLPELTTNSLVELLAETARRIEKPFVNKKIITMIVNCSRAIADNTEKLNRFKRIIEQLDPLQQQALSEWYKLFCNVISRSASTTSIIGNCFTVVLAAEVLLPMNMSRTAKHAKQINMAITDLSKRIVMNFDFFFEQPSQEKQKGEIKSLSRHSNSRPPSSSIAPISVHESISDAPLTKYKILASSASLTVPQGEHPRTHDTNSITHQCEKHRYEKISVMSPQRLLVHHDELRAELGLTTMSSSALGAMRRLLVPPSHSSGGSLMCIQPSMSMHTPAPRRGASAVFIQHRNSVVLFGGITDKQHNDVWRFHEDSMSWCVENVRGEPPCARHDHAAAGLGHQMFVYGGITGFRCLDDMYRLDTATWKWFSIEFEGMLRGPEARCGHTMVSSKSHVIVFGGQSGSPSSSRYHNDLWTFDGTMWSRPSVKGQPPRARRDCRACLVRPGLHVFYGGANNAETFSDMFLLEEIDNHSFMWNVVWADNHRAAARDEAPQASHAQYILALQSRIFVISDELAAHTSTSFRPTIWRFSADFGTWKRCSPLSPTPSSRASGVCVMLGDENNRAFLSCGIAKRKCLNDAWIFEINSCA